MTPRNLWLGAGAATAVLGLVWIVGRQQDAGQRSERRLAALEQALAETRAEQASPQPLPQPQVVVMPPPPVAAPPASASAAPAPDDPPPAHHGPATAAELDAVYQAQFAEEPIEQNFAREARATYLPAIQQFLPASSKIESLECRSRFCRLEVKHDNPDEETRLLTRLFTLDHQGPLFESSGGFHASAPVKTADGKYSYEVFIAGKGVNPMVTDPAQEGAPPATL